MTGRVLSPVQHPYCVGCGGQQVYQDRLASNRWVCLSCATWFQPMAAPPRPTFDQDYPSPPDPMVYRPELSTSNRPHLVLVPAHDAPTLAELRELGVVCLYLVGFWVAVFALYLHVAG
jgi:hypothetical protein